MVTGFAEYVRKSVCYATYVCCEAASSRRPLVAALRSGPHGDPTASRPKAKRRRMERLQMCAPPANGSRMAAARCSGRTSQRMPVGLHIPGGVAGSIGPVSAARAVSCSIRCGIRGTVSSTQGAATTCPASSRLDSVGAACNHGAASRCGSNYAALAACEYDSTQSSGDRAG